MLKLNRTSSSLSQRSLLNISSVDSPPTPRKPQSARRSSSSSKLATVALPRLNSADSLSKLSSAEAWAPAPAAGTAASSRASLAAGFGLRQATVGHSAHFVMMAHSADGRALHSGGHAAWEVRVFGPGRARVGLLDHDDGQTTARYTCECSGKHRVSIRLGKVHLMGSPFDVNVDVAFHPRSALQAATMAQKTVRGLFARWAASQKSSRPRHRGRLHAVSNGWALNELRKGVLLWRRAMPHIQRGRLARGMHALGVWRIASHAFADLCAVAGEETDSRRRQKGWAQLRSRCASRAKTRAARRSLATTARRASLRRYRRLGMAAWKALMTERLASERLQLQSMRRALMVARQVQLAKAARTWKDATRSRHMKRRITRRLEDVLGRHTRMRRVQLLVGGMEAWVAWRVRRRAWNRELVLLRFRNEHKRKWRLACAIRAWLGHRATLDGLAHLLLRADPQARRRLLAQAMWSWRERQARLQLEGRMVGECEDRRHAARERHALSCWCAFREAMRKLRRVVRHLSYRQLSVGLRTWMAYAIAHARSMRILRFGLGRLYHRQLVDAIEQWLLFSRWTVHITWAVARFTRREQARAFASWSAYASTHRKVRGFLADCLPWLLHAKHSSRLQARALLCWRKLHAVEGPVRHCALRLVARRYRRHVRGAFSVWFHVVKPRSMDARLRRKHRRGHIHVESFQSAESYYSEVQESLERSRRLMQESMQQRQESVPKAKPAGRPTPGGWSFTPTKLDLTKTCTVVRLSVSKSHYRTIAESNPRRRSGYMTPQ